ncbi:MAG: hypothetical protein AB7O67_07300 [Vicinamibacterales bacterium]
MARLASRFLGLAFAALFVVSVTAQTNVSGSWDLEVNGPQGTVTATMVLEQDGENLKGTIDGDMGKVPLEGAVAGNLIKINFTVDAGGQYIPIVLYAEIDGDSLKGSMDYGQGAAETTGKRTSF